MEQEEKVKVPRFVSTSSAISNNTTDIKKASILKRVSGLLAGEHVVFVLMG